MQIQTIAYYFMLIYIKENIVHFRVFGFCQIRFAQKYALVFYELA